VNWLDILLIVLLAVFVFEGVRQGFARLAIGMAATLIGILLAAWFYGSAGALLLPYVSSRALANAAGFLIVFIGIQIAGALLGWALATLFKWTGLSWLDRLLGALLGAVKTAVVGVVLVLILTAFPLKPIPDSIAGSQSAPYLIEASHVLVYLCPRELRDGFKATYDRVRDLWSGRGDPDRRKPASLPKDSV
jgi:membrane protein required for colicin V production